MEHTKKIQLYSLSELKQEQQEKAHSEWLSSHYEYFWWGKNAGVLCEFEQRFPVKIEDYEYGDFGRGFVRHSMRCDSKVSELSGIRLLSHLWNNHKWDLYEGKYYSSKGNKSRHSKIVLEPACLTGYCVGYDILKPMHNFMNKPDKHTTFEDLIKDCLNSWLESCEKDVEYSQSFEAFAEECEANSLEFYEDGRNYE